MSDFSEVLGSLTLSDVCEDVRIEDESGGYFADMGHQIPGRPGVQYDDDADLAPLVLSMRVILKATDAPQNLSKIKAELRKSGLVALKRTLSYPSNQIRAMVKLVTKPIQTDPVVYTFILTAPSGSWQDASESSETGNPPTATTSGDTEIHDPRLTISAAGETEVTLSDGTVYTITAAAGPTYPVVVDVGAGTVLDNGGADAAGDVAFSHEHWLRLDADSAVSITTDNSVTLHWRNRWS